MRKKSQAAFESNQVLQQLEALQTALGEDTDFVMQQIPAQSGTGEQPLRLFYMESIVDKQLLQEMTARLLDLVSWYKTAHAADKPIAPDRQEASGTPPVVLQRALVSYGATPLQDSEAFISRILSGSVLVAIEDGTMTPLAIPLAKWEDRGVAESKTQSVIKGPQDAFLETLDTNISLVRRRIKNPQLRLHRYVVGKQTQTDVVIMYLKHTADGQLVEQVKQQIGSLQLDTVLETQYIEEILTGKTFSLFPTLYNTDRPDTVAANVLEGKIAVFVDGTPFVLLGPVTFTDFMQSAEDYYQSYIYSNLIRMLRYIALAISLLAPSVYIAFTTFHQDILPTQLLLSLAAQREGIPFPAFVEALVMELAFEILREAGIRMPRTIGQAVSIVGTIVIGQAAVEAGIVSAAMVIIVAITAVSSFVVPAYQMAIGFRMFRFVLMLFAASFGIYGLTLGLLILVLHLSSLYSLGQPFIAPMAHYNRGQQSDTLLRLPYWLFNDKARSSNRLKGGTEQ